MNRPKCELSVATLNIWHDAGPWAVRRRLIREELARLQADVVGLQEVLERGDGRGQADELAAGLGYEVVFGAASPRSDGVWHGNALLTRLPVRRQAVAPLPSEGVEARSMLYVAVGTRLGELPVFVTHLAWEPHLAAVREKQVRALLAETGNVLDAWPGAMPAVLMGDLNAAPQADELRPLDEGWADAWSLGGDGPGVTFDPENDYARAWEEPPQRLDYVFVATDSRVRVRYAETAFASPAAVAGQQVWPSDHYGVVCGLELTP